VEKKINNGSNKIPVPIGAYSPAVKMGNILFISGQLPIDPNTGNIVEGNIQIQTKQILENLKKLLKLYSFTLNDVVKTTIFLENMDNFSEFNQAYAEYFRVEYPARSCVGVTCLAKNAAIEIEAIAMQ